MELSDVAELIGALLASGNPIFVKGLSGVLLILIIVLVISTIIDVLKKFKDLTSSAFETLSSSIPRPTKSKHDDVKRRLRIDYILQDVLGDAVKEYNLGRAMILQFHNGIKMKSGMPFEYIVLTHEAVGKGKASSTMMMRSYDIRIFADGLSEVIIDQATVVHPVEELPSVIQDFCAENGDAHVMVTALTDVMNPDMVIGILIFARSMGHKFHEHEKENIIKCADKCSGILSTSWGACESCSKHDEKGKKGCSKEKQRDNIHSDCRSYIPIYNEKEE